MKRLFGWIEDGYSLIAFAIFIFTITVKVIGGYVADKWKQWREEES